MLTTCVEMSRVSLTVWSAHSSVLSLHLLHHHIQSDESASAAHTCTAVDQQWLVLGGWEQFTDMTNEPDDRHDIVWNSVIWPGSVVELSIS